MRTSWRRENLHKADLVDSYHRIRENLSASIKQIIVEVRSLVLTSSPLLILKCERCFNHLSQDSFQVNSVFSLIKFPSQFLISSHHIVSLYTEFANERSVGQVKTLSYLTFFSQQQFKSVSIIFLVANMNSRTKGCINVINISLVFLHWENNTFSILLYCVIIAANK